MARKWSYKAYLWQGIVAVILKSSSSGFWWIFIHHCWLDIINKHNVVQSEIFQEIQDCAEILFMDIDVYISSNLGRGLPKVHLDPDVAVSYLWFYVLTYLIETTELH